MATPEGRTEDGFETQFGTNHVGHFLLFQLLKPALLASSTPSFNSRVVSPSGSLCLVGWQTGKHAVALACAHVSHEWQCPQLILGCKLIVRPIQVALSSAGHRRSPVHLDDLDLKTAGYDPWVAYGQSKTANIYLANEIERRYGSQGGPLLIMFS